MHWFLVICVCLITGSLINIRYLLHAIRFYVRFFICGSRPKGALSYMRTDVTPNRVMIADIDAYVCVCCVCVVYT